MHPRDTMNTTMATGDNDNDVNGDGATGNKVDDNGNCATGDNNDNDDDGDGDNNRDGNGAMGSGVTGDNNDDNDGNGRQQRQK